jgi:hypothetical protein
MIDDPGKKRRDLERGGERERGRIKGFHLGKRRTAGTTSARDADDRPTTADTLVAHEVEEKAGVSAAESGPGDTAALGTQEPKIRSSSLSRLPPQNRELLLSRRIIQPPDATINLNLDADYPDHHYDDYDSDDNEIVEVPRGREGHLGMSANEMRPAFRRTMSGPVGRMAEMSTPPPSTTTTTIFPRSSSILPPIFPSLNIPLSYSPHSQPAGSGSNSGSGRSRPRTAPTTISMPISPSPFASVPTTTSRPGTGDSTAAGSIRHHRLDSIRGTTHGQHVQGQRTPPTRDSSPSRSVRFVDYVDGESGHVGPFGPVGGSTGGNENEGRKVPVDTTNPHPLPSSRSSSFYRDGNGPGRTLVGGSSGPMEGDASGPPVSAASVATTTVRSRPPTR